MPAITSDKVNYLVWRYLREEGLALSGFTLDKETHASQWDSEFKSQTGDGELVKLVLKGLQMLEIEKVRIPPELVASAQAKPVNLEEIKPPAPLKGGFVTALVVQSHAQQSNETLLVGGPGGVGAYSLPGLEAFDSGAFAATEVPTCIETHAATGTVFIGYDNGAVRGWMLANNSAELTSVFMLPDADHAPVTGLRWAPSGQLLASIDVRNVVALWDTQTRTLASRIDLGGMDSPLLTDAVWVTDTMLAVLQLDSVAVYTIGEAAPRKIFQTPRVSQLAFDSVSRLLVSGSDDGRVCLWSSNSDEPYRSIDDHTGPITFVGWVADAPITQPNLLTASTDGWLKLWSLAEPQPVSTANAGDPIYSVQTSDSYIAAITKRGVKVYTRTLICVAEYTKEGVQSIGLRGRTLVVAAKSETSVFEIKAA